MTSFLVIGYGTDRTVLHVRSTAAAERRECELLDLRALGDASDATVRLASDRGLVIRAGAWSADLRPGDVVYQRLLAPHPWSVDPATFRRWSSRLAALAGALEEADLLVVNPPAAGWENSSKPLQLLLLAAHGFHVPDSLVTTSGSELAAFAAGRSLVYKSTSGVRSVVHEVAALDPERLDASLRCPVLFQERIVGPDVRVHVVGRSTFAVLIQSDVVDYRYAHLVGAPTRMAPADDVPGDVLQRCVDYAAARGVVLAGFDFKVDADGTWWCLEMNPAPAFESYDHVLGGAIARSLLRSGRGHRREHAGGGRDVGSSVR